MERDQRRAACGVDGERGAFEAERVRDASGGDTRRVSDPDVSLERVVFGLDEAIGIVAVVDADEDSGRGALERRRWKPCMLERLPRGLEKKALLWIDGERFTRADAEELGIEELGVVEEAAVTDVRPSARVGI